MSIKAFGCRPLAANVNPDDLADGSYAEPCPKCGTACVVRPLLERQALAVNQSIEFVCTSCALRLGQPKRS